MNLRTDGGFFVSYSQQVLSVLVGERRRAIVRDRGRDRPLHIRRRVAGAVYALAKAVTVLAVVLDDDPVRPAAERAR
jgi:hypothetical protein